MLGSFVADAATEATDTTDTIEDAGLDVVTKRPRDAATSDAGPRPVVCEAQPCATSLTTTLGGRGEGYCALLQDGRVACWGENRLGQLGRADTEFDFYSATAAPVAGLSNITFLHHTCAIDEDGATWCWGTGPYLRDPSELVTTERTPVKLPIPPATMVAVGWDLHSTVAVGCAVVDTGLLCWGTNRNAQVAQLDLDASSLGILPPAPHALPPGAPIKQLAVGTATFVVRNDGTLSSWGANPPLGRVSSLAPNPYPEPIALDGVSGIEVAHDNACAVAQGIAYCWGAAEVLYDEDYDLVDPLERALPYPVPTPEPLVQIATTPPSRNMRRPLRACAVGVSGDVYCWGGNTFGQAGDGTKEYAVTPVKVAGLPAPTAEVRVTATSTCAILTSGKLFCWGDGAEGQLGNGQLFVPSLTPIEVQLP